MDEYELDRVATNNPALWPPTTQDTSVQRHRSRGTTRGTHTASDPSGRSQESLEPEDYTTKYDVRFLTTYILQTHLPCELTFLSFLQTAWLAQNRPQLLSLLVLRNDRHRRRVSASRFHPVSCRLALLALRLFLRSQCYSLLVCLVHFRLPLCRVSGDMAGHDCRQCQFALPGHSSHGLFDAHICLVLDLYSILGTLGCAVCMGLLDD